MSNALSTALNGITSAVARTTQSVGNIVNASSTGNNLEQNLVAVKVDQTDVAADAAVIKTVDKMNKALLDITV